MDYVTNGWGTLDNFFVGAQGDVRAIVAYLRSLGKYKMVGAAGLCYSGTIFLGAQASNGLTPLFDKLIVDTSFQSLLDMALRVFKDPKLCCNHRTGGAPKAFQWLLSTLPVRVAVKMLGYLVLGKQFGDNATANFASRLQSATPILILHGKFDMLVPTETLRRVYEVAPKDTTCAMEFPSYHVRLHLEDQKELYAFIVNRFVEPACVADFVNEVQAVAPSKIMLTALDEAYEAWLQSADPQTATNERSRLLGSQNDGK